MSTVSEKVHRSGVTKEPGFLYFLNKEGNVARARMLKPGQQKTEEAEVLAVCGVKREPDFLYYIDSDGDVARSPAKRSGTVGAKHRRRRGEAGAAAKKAAKKPAAKKAAKKVTKKVAKKIVKKPKIAKKFGKKTTAKR